MKKNLSVFLNVILAILVIGIVFQLITGKTEKVETFNVDTISVGQPELGIERARFYLVKNQWGYSFVQFKDTGLDKKLDRVFCLDNVFLNDLGFPFSPERFNPSTGFPSDKVFDPNSPDWGEWLLKFEKVLQEHEKKLKRQKGLSR
ncbi:hypothetical protein AMJ47_03155 [Parcubacteria bacterium DG_72]|nr:MAG: hypothetical protein AMJ47_03155 [Parcubacteria bacterium DG_72]